MQLVEEAVVLHERVHKRALAAVGASLMSASKVGVRNTAQHVSASRPVVGIATLHV